LSIDGTRCTFPARLKADSRRLAVGFVAWIVVGLIAGWLAGQVMKGGGYGIVVDIILGILGGVLGGWVFGLLGIWSGGGMIGSIIVAFVGAVILVWLTRLLKKPEKCFTFSSHRERILSHHAFDEANREHPSRKDPQYST
jgi:uncharacterized membrane protein YeaQ/YmgE (transglycosylase-associated protein family)